VSAAPSLDLVTLDEALSRLAETEPAKAELVKPRFLRVVEAFRPDVVMTGHTRSILYPACVSMLRAIKKKPSNDR
jgi:hypothetical protein